MTSESNDEPNDHATDDWGDRIIAARTSRCTCQVAADHRAELLAFADSVDPEQPAGFELVKSSTVRATWRGTVAGTAVHLKVFRAGSLSDRARDLVRGARASTELRALRAARARGLPGVEPLLAAVLRGTGPVRSLLVTRTEPGTPLPRGPLEPGVAQAAGRLLRAAHDAGLQTTDLHPGNVLRRADGSLVLLDLTGARFGDSLATRARARALAFFCGDLDGGVGHPAARPLVSAYGAGPELLERAFRDGVRLRARQLLAFGRRALRPCAHTEVRRIGGATWFLHRPAAALHAEAQALLGGQRPSPTKQGRRGGVWLGERVVLKQREPALARQLFVKAYWLAFARVPAPAPVALTRGAVFLERLPGPTLEQELAAGLGHAESVRAARRLGEAVGRLHAHGLRCRDLKLANLIRDPRSGDVALVDHDGVRQRTPAEMRGRATDLGRLLAAFDAAGAPHRHATIFAFLRGYTAALQWLRRERVSRHLLRRSEARARSWASAHGSTPTAWSAGSGGSATSAGS